MNTSTLSQIQVRGFRMNRLPRGGTDYGVFAARHSLAALDPVSLTPVAATWTYENGGSGVVSEYFIDTHPEWLLTVTASGYAPVTVNAARVTAFSMLGTPFPQSLTHNAFIAVDDSDVVATWPPGEFKPAAADNHDAKTLYASVQAAGALRHDGSIFVWGNPGWGGQLKPTDASRTDVVDMYLCFSGLLRGTQAPFISEWGGALESAPLPDEIAASENIIKLNGRDFSMQESSFQALNDAGQIFAWGVNELGSLPAEIAALTDIIDVTGTGIDQVYL